LVIGLRSCFHRGEYSQVELLAVEIDLRHPSGAAPGNAFESSGTARSDVAIIFSAGAFTQIGDAVIAAIAVPVIDFFPRVLTGDMEPSEPMRAITGIIDHDFAISAPVPGARLLARACAAASHPPIKKPRFRGVIENLPQPFRGDAWLHANLR
jgi:hypothetical protein